MVQTWAKKIHPSNDGISYGMFPPAIKGHQETEGVDLHADRLDMPSKLKLHTGVLKARFAQMVGPLKWRFPQHSNGISTARISGHDYFHK